MQNQQVALMGEIYGTAECVIVWLGLADALIPSAWKLLGSMREPSRRTTLRERTFRNENFGTRIDEGGLDATSMPLIWIGNHWSGF